MAGGESGMARGGAGVKYLGGTHTTAVRVQDRVQRFEGGDVGAGGEA